MTGYIALSIGNSKMKNDRDFILAYKHNYRVHEPLNADPALKTQNEELISLNGKNYLQAYQTRMAETEQYRNSAPRKNAVRGFEVIQSFSRSELDRIDMEKWKADNIAWLKRTFNKNPEKYGENVISAVFHADEAGNPHIHAMIIPIDGKGHLNYSAYVDGPQNMRELYDDYAKFMKQEHGLERGTKYSVARHEDVKRFYTNVNKAVATEAPELLPGETAQEYKARADEFVKDNALAIQARELEIQRKADERISGYKAKSSEKSKEIKELKETIKDQKSKITVLRVDLNNAENTAKEYKTRQEEFEAEYGDMPSIRKKLNTINALVIAFDNHPDEELREAVRQQVNEFVSWGMLQKQLQDKRASEKELTK